MLYRPNFCCHCGEKIARARWTPLTSRRFCDFCEIEQKQHDLIPRATIVIAVLFGAAGLTAYLGRSGESDASSARPAARVSQLRRDVQSKAVSPGAVANTELSSADRSGTEEPDANANIGVPNAKQRNVAANSSTEPVYYCGALTKKRTPCTRRVKTKGRCWQHAGQPAVDRSPE
jgi:hypothetical protein